MDETWLNIFLSLVPGTGQVPHCKFMKWICWGKIILVTWFYYFWGWRKLALLGIGELAVSWGSIWNTCWKEHANDFFFFWVRNDEDNINLKWMWSPYIWGLVFVGFFFFFWVMVCNLESRCKKPDSSIMKDCPRCHSGVAYVPELSEAVCGKWHDCLWHPGWQWMKVTLEVGLGLK